MSRKDHRFTESPVLKDQLAGWRIHLVSALIFGALLALVGRAFYLQIINEDFLQERGDARYRRVLDIPASRGKILDRHGDMLAQSTPMRAVWATADAKLDKDQLKALGNLLEMDPRQIEKKLTGDKSFVYLKHQVSPDAAARIAALKLPGIQMDREYSRFYPAGDMVAHMVGFTGKDDRGQEGVELAFESRLVGKNGERTVIKDRRGQIVEEVGSERPPQDGDDIQLGGMIEIPAAALALNMFLKRLDFVSIGTNDLTQYTLAIDRGDEEVADLYDSLHPAVLMLIAHTLAGAEKSGVPVSICGELAGNPKLTRLLLGMGLRHFSMHPAQILEVKQQILTSDVGQLAPMVRKLLRLDDPAQIREQIRRLNSTPADSLAR